MSDDGGYERGGFDRCEELSPYCPVEATVLGYAPNLGSSIFFTVAFGLCLVAAAVLGVWKKTWTFAAAICAGLILETSGKSTTRMEPRCLFWGGRRRSKGKPPKVKKEEKDTEKKGDQVVEEKTREEGKEERREKQQAD